MSSLILDEDPNAKNTFGSTVLKERITHFADILIKRRSKYHEKAELLNKYNNIVKSIKYDFQHPTFLTKEQLTEIYFLAQQVYGYMK